MATIATQQARPRRIWHVVRIALAAYFTLCLAWSLGHAVTVPATRAQWTFNTALAAALTIVTLTIRRPPKAAVQRVAPTQADASRRVDDAVAYAKANSLDCLLVVAIQPPRARTGTKIVARRYTDPNSPTFDAWIGQHWPNPGDLLIGPTTTSHGPHSNRPNVIYMGTARERAVNVAISAATVRDAHDFRLQNAAISAP